MITELSTFCSNDRAEILEDDGTKVRFCCRMDLCGKYPICVIGEFGLRLPSTDIHCVIINVTGTSENGIFHREKMRKEFSSRGSMCQSTECKGFNSTTSKNIH